MGNQLTERKLGDLLFVGMNRRVAALDRFTGEIVWSWKAPQGTGFAAVYLDGDRLIAAVNGYVYCLDPIFGQQVWSNPMKGFGHGVASLASVHGNSSSQSAAAQEIARQQAAAAAAAT